MTGEDGDLMAAPRVTGSGMPPASPASALPTWQPRGHLWADITEEEDARVAGEALPPAPPPLPTFGNFFALAHVNPWQRVGVMGRCAGGRSVLRSALPQIS